MTTADLTPPPVPQPLPPPKLGLSIADRISLPVIHWGWLLLIIGLMALFWAARGVIGPFVAGFVVAYLLNPPTQRLQNLGLPRWLAAIISLLLFLIVLAGIGFASVPIIQAQILQLIQSLPALIEQAQPLVTRLLRRTAGAAQGKAILENISSRAVGWLSDSVGPIVAGGLAFVNVLMFVVVTPLVAFYLLRDWPVIITRIDSWWPRRQLAAVQALLSDCNAALGGFVRGQSLVCLSLALYYAIGWSIVGLDYAVVLGLLAGVLGFVPFIGIMFAVVLSLLVALGQFGFDGLHIGLVLGVFAIGQVLESSVLTPNLIGNRIGLHPVWVLFAVFAGGKVGGLAGVFLAVPVAAVLGVLVRWALAHYRSSQFYGTAP